MLDTIKISTSFPGLIDKVCTRLLRADFVVGRNRNNRFGTFIHRQYGNLLKIDLQKVYSGGELAGYRSADITISPHYHFNGYRHNGNDLTVTYCIAALKDIFKLLEFSESDLTELNVTSIEFGVNLIPAADTKKIIDGLLYHGRRKFTLPKKKLRYFKKAGSNYLSAKAYAKGIQCHDTLNAPEIDINAFRFEVKSRETKKVKSFGTRTAADLLRPEVYGRLAEVILQEWDKVLLIESEPNLDGLNAKERQTIRAATAAEWWHKTNTEQHRNKFSRERKKYYNMLQKIGSNQSRIKEQIIDKLKTLLNGANSTQPTPIKSDNLHSTENTPDRINLENAPLRPENSICSVTGLDISMQRKNSKCLGIAGLKYYQENEPLTFRQIAAKYLTKEMAGRSQDEQFYYMAHNIRNEKYNPKNNRRQFIRRNYPQGQMRFEFGIPQQLPSNNHR